MRVEFSVKLEMLISKLKELGKIILTKIKP